jgi:hypothetical protein
MRLARQYNNNNNNKKLDDMRIQEIDDSEFDDVVLSHTHTHQQQQ